MDVGKLSWPQDLQDFSFKKVTILFDLPDTC